MPSEPAFDAGLLSPVTVGRDELVSDTAFLDALVRAEVALAGAYADVGVAPLEEVQRIEREFQADRGARTSTGLESSAIAEAAVAGGNPVIPLVSQLKARVDVDAGRWIHRGATSQDILDTAVILVAAGAVTQVRASLAHTTEWLLQLAERHRDDVAAARTLTQHAVPTTVGLRAVTWARAVRRAADRLAGLELPAQLGGAGGTLASFVEITGSVEAARALVARYADRLQLVTPDAPWHVTRWPITELADALVQAVDALGVFATDVATLSRTEIGELAEGVGGGSSAMPQKQNPTEAVLIRSAAIRAPHLGATLHTAAALAVDERPDGAWHAEWPTLRELLRLALGASAHASSLAAHLRVDTAAAARNLGATRGLILAERLSLVLGPEAAKAVVAEIEGGADAADAVRRAAAASGVDVDDLLDPARYTGAAAALVDDALRSRR
ncbi:lyase family protein [Microbacterium sp.]|uniref:lyase family protein n=1 Tax=Microbacterium sp. TaxID=51671 RepID=UPI003F6F1185